MQYSNLVYVHTLINIVDNKDLIKRFNTLFYPLVSKYFDFDENTWDLSENELFSKYTFDRFLDGPNDFNNLNYYCNSVLSCSYKNEITHFKRIMKAHRVSYLKKKIDILSKELDKKIEQNELLEKEYHEIKANMVLIKKRNVMLKEDNKGLKRLITYI